jgi:hypothetical protein
MATTAKGDAAPATGTFTVAPGRTVTFRATIVSR